MSENQSPLKRCSRGEQCAHPNGPLLPATTEYFARSSETKDGFQYRCKACASWYYFNKHEANRERGQKYSKEHAEEANARAKKWREDNPERYKATHARLYQENKEQILQKQRDKRQSDPDYNAKNRMRKKKYPESIRAANHRRKASKRKLPSTLTTKEWQRGLNYFDGRCAVCGKVADFWTIIVPDHWIPLSSPDCLGTTALNIIPLCHAKSGVPSGKTCCNNSKGHTMPDAWLNRRYGKRRAKIILDRIEAYFEWVRQQDGDG